MCHEGGYATNNRCRRRRQSHPPVGVQQKVSDISYHEELSILHPYHEFEGILVRATRPSSCSLAPKTSCILV